MSYVTKKMKLYTIGKGRTNLRSYRRWQHHIKVAASQRLIRIVCSNRIIWGKP